MKSNAKKRDTNRSRRLCAGYTAIGRAITVNGQRHTVQLLVPVEVRKELEAEENQRQLREREEIAVKCLQVIEHAFRGPEPAPEPPPKSLLQLKQEKEDAQYLAEVQKQQAIWDAHAAAGKALARRAQYPVFQPAEAMALFRRMALYQRDDRERFQRVYDQLCASGHLRALARPSAAAFQRLAASQPHMAPVVEFVGDQIELARRARKPLRIAPILLVGEAGIGKTHFAQGLAQALCAPLSIQRLDSDLTGSQMLGSDRKWGNSHHGLLFNMLALGDAANPVVVLDEIDKINRLDQRVQSSLYSLLEPVSAGRLRDISLDFEFDASLVIWIATANDVRRLDEPLRSRFKEFHIQLPTADQCLVLAREVIHATIRNAGVRGFSVQTNRLECDLAHLPARQIQQITREAMARALKAGRMGLHRRDLPPGVLDSDELHGRNGGYLH